MNPFHKYWRYPNTLLLILSIGAAFYLSTTPQADVLITQLSGLGLLGGFIVGIFFVVSFTTAPAAVVIYHLALVYDPIPLAIAAGLGSMVGDYAIFCFFKDRLFDEWKPLIERVSRERHLQRLIASPFFFWLAPVFGAAIIASPLPDEIGISLLGISKLKNWQFLSLTWILNTAGMFLIALAARANA